MHTHTHTHTKWIAYACLYFMCMFLKQLHDCVQVLIIICDMQYIKKMNKKMDVHARTHTHNLETYMHTETHNN